MKAYVSTTGDRSAGINPHTTVIDFGSLTLDEREFAREVLRDAFGAVLDEAVTVQFDDECPDCGKVSCSGTCMTPEPPSHGH